MTAEERIKHTIGDLIVQLYAALAKIEELEAKLAKPDLPPGTTDATREAWDKGLKRYSDLRAAE